MLYLRKTKRKLEYFSLQPILKISKSACISSACQPASQPASQPAVRPGCARCRAPEISHDKGNGGGFTKMFCSEDDLPTAPWRFLLSFFLLPCSSL